MLIESDEVLPDLNDQTVLPSTLNLFFFYFFLEVIIMDTDEFEHKFEELTRKWHKLLKLLNKKEVIDNDEQENLELQEYLDRRFQRAWSR